MHAKLVATQQKLATLQTDHEEQTTNPVAVEEALQQYQKAYHDASPATPRSVEGMLQGDKIERFISGLKEDIRKKVLVDPKGDGGPWEDIKRLINYAVTIDATYI